MRPRSAAVVACRIIALFIGIEALMAIISFLLIARSLSGTSVFWAYAGTRLVVAYALWIMAAKLGEVMARRTDEPTASVQSTLNIQTIAFTIVGVVLIVQAIPSLIEIAFNGAPGFGDFARLQFSPLGGYFGSRGAAIASQIVRLGLGAGLIFGARPLAEALRRRDPQEPTPQQ